MLESEKKLQTCFCPHGYSTATTGHYHCRHCGLSCRYVPNVLRHEKVHRDYVADKANPFSQKETTSQYFSCRHCGYLSRREHNLRQHERVHTKSQKVTDKQASVSHSAVTQAGTGILLETTAKLRVSGTCTIGCFYQLLILYSVYTL